MKDILAHLKKRGIDRSYAELGLDFAVLFPAAERSRVRQEYGRHEWLVKSEPRYGTIINAVPPEDRIGELPWEEWYVLERKNHHHVLYLREPPHYDEVFQAPDFDDIHPPRTLGKKWYVVDDPDMSPVLLR